MPPNFSGLEMPSRPRLPAFLKISWIGKRPSFSHCSTCGLISRSTKLWTVRRSSSCSWVKIIVVLLVGCAVRTAILNGAHGAPYGLETGHAEGAWFKGAYGSFGADIQQVAEQLEIG